MTWANCDVSCWYRCSIGWWIRSYSITNRKRVSISTVHRSKINRGRRSVCEALQCDCLGQSLKSGYSIMNVKVDINCVGTISTWAKSDLVIGTIVSQASVRGARFDIILDSLSSINREVQSNSLLGQLSARIAIKCLWGRGEDRQTVEVDSGSSADSVNREVDGELMSSVSTGREINYSSGRSVSHATSTTCVTGVDHCFPAWNWNKS